MEIKSQREHTISLTEHELRCLATCVSFANQGAVMTHGWYTDAYEFSKEFLRLASKGLAPEIIADLVGTPDYKGMERDNG